MRMKATVGRNICGTASRDVTPPEARAGERNVLRTCEAGDVSSRHRIKIALSTILKFSAFFEDDSISWRRHTAHTSRSSVVRRPTACIQRQERERGRERREGERRRKRERERDVYREPEREAKRRSEKGGREKEKGK